MAIEHLKEFYGKPKKKKTWIVPEGYDPLADCPPERRRQFEPLAERCRAGSLPAMAKLFCLQCMGFYRAEVKNCEAKTCALFARNMRTEG